MQNKIKTKEEIQELIKIYNGRHTMQNKVKTKEELLELLKRYKGILTEPMLNYLNSLIELEFSVIREYISTADRKALAELEIYKKVAIYNIYNRAQNLFNKQNGEYPIFVNKNGLKGLSVTATLPNRTIELFNFDYKEIQSSSWETPKIPMGFKTMEIGNISLFQTVENKEVREIELERIMKKLERLYDENNPYPSSPFIIGGPGTTWEFDHKREIQEYEEKFKELDSKKELSDEDKKEIEITNQIHDLFLEDYGLTNESFIDENNKYNINFGKEKSKLNKTLVRKMPNLTIKNHTKYI